MAARNRATCKLAWGRSLRGAKRIVFALYRFRPGEAKASRRLECGKLSFREPGREGHLGLECGTHVGSRETRCSVSQVRIGRAGSRGGLNDILFVSSPEDGLTAQPVHSDGVIPWHCGVISTTMASIGLGARLGRHSLMKGLPRQGRQTGRASLQPRARWG